MSDSNTATVTKVAGSASSVQLLAANGQRKAGSAIQNDSTAILYVKFGTVAATSDDYSVRLAQYDYFEIPDGYTGAIQGIWASTTGAARVTEVK